MPSRPVILDTNFLLVPFQFKINIIKELVYLLDFSHYYVISSKTIDELEKLTSTVGKHAAAARLALKLIESNDIKIIKDNRHVDDWILEYAAEKNAIVCTNDGKLRRKLKSMKIKIITMKSKSRLGFV
ncbi:DNA-binding protein [Candidatus Micrarchaeota archaeon]|nr:DNA-binding protein [Candidatus Micrarchaeota archaeon]